MGRSSTSGGDPVLTDDVKSGDRVKALVAIRDQLAVLLEGAAPRDGASLAKQLADTIDKIEAAAPPKTKGTPLDEVAKQRAKRGATAPRTVRPPRSAKRR